MSDNTFDGAAKGTGAHSRHASVVQVPDAKRFDAVWAGVALFGTLTSLALALGFSLLRLGLQSPPLLLPSCVLVVAAALFGPLLLPSRGIFAEAENRAVAMPLIALAIFATVAGALLLGPILLVFHAGLAAIAVVRGALLWRSIKIRAALGLLALALLFAMYLFFAVHSRSYAGISTPEQAMLGLVHHDPIFHSSIAYLIQNFGIASQGLDGIIPARYHFGSHIWFAGLSALGGTSPTWSYGAAVPVVVAPLLVVALILAAVAIDGARKKIASYLLVGLGIMLLSDVIGYFSYYISESYAFGIIGFLLLLPLLVWLTKPQPSNTLIALGLMIAVLVIPVLTLMKLSVGVLWCTAMGWVVFRRFCISWVTALTGIVAALFLFGTLAAIAPQIHDYQKGNTALWVPFYLLWVFPSVSTFACLLLPLCFIFVLKRDHGASWRRIFSEKRDLLLEALILVTLVGAIPPMIGVPQDSSVWYFFNVAQWMSMCLLIIRFAPDDMAGALQSAWKNALLVPVAAVVAFLFLSATEYRNLVFFETMKRVVEAADRTVDGTLLKGRTATGYFVDSLRSEGVLWGKDFRDALAASPGSRLIDFVRSSTPRPDPGLAVFIPPTNTSYWSMAPACSDKHNIQVALSGQPSLFGGPPSSYGCDFDYYWTPYGQDHLSRDLTDAELCDRARLRQISRVLIFADGGKGSGENRELDCPAAS